jgi:hypothetical protein
LDWIEFYIYFLLYEGSSEVLSVAEKIRIRKDFYEKEKERYISKINTFQ